MASLAKIKTNEKRKALVARYAERRAELKEILVDRDATESERTTARQALDALPRNSSAVRVRNRCVITGRPRGVYRKFGLSRIALRHYALRGELPGVTKASW